jgi:hypothetical protein
VVRAAKEFVGSNLKFAVSNEEEFADEIKSLGFEDSGEEVNVGCWTEKQRFKMRSTDEFETEDLIEFVEELRTGKVRRMFIKDYINWRTSIQTSGGGPADIRMRTILTRGKYRSDRRLLWERGFVNCTQLYTSVFQA